MSTSSITDAHEAAITELAAAGDWLTAEQRCDVWRQARDATTNPLDRARAEAVTPAAVEGRHPATDHLPAAAVEVAHRLASDPGRLTRAWADEQIDELGEETYTEVVGVTSIAMVIDRLRRALGLAPVDLPVPRPGEPSRIRPDDVGDIGAWVSQTTGETRANVSRTLSLVPVTNATWRQLVDSHYSRGSQFMSKQWDRALSRPQVEMIASRTTSVNECFY